MKCEMESLKIFCYCFWLQEDARKSLEAQLAAKQEEIQGIEERASNSDAVVSRSALLPLSR